MNPSDLAAHGPVIPVIVLERVQDAVPLVEALLAGGVRVLEVTLRTAALVLHRGHRQGAARRRWSVQARCAARSMPRSPSTPARFGVSPGAATLGHACRNMGLPLLPGVATASEVMAASAGGYGTFRSCFPAEAWAACRR
ncbi:MAG: hypothetical protein IPM99_15820 [Rubrivivax sp.]|nr:hypothetical protein [Rubrivivax sp.]